MNAGVSAHRPQAARLPDAGGSGSAGRLASDEFRGEGDLTMLVIGVGGLLQQQFGSSLTEPTSRLTHR